jgi:hypothetical protein
MDVFSCHLAGGLLGALRPGCSFCFVSGTGLRRKSRAGRPSCSPWQHGLGLRALPLHRNRPDRLLHGLLPRAFAACAAARSATALAAGCGPACCSTRSTSMRFACRARCWSWLFEHRKSWRSSARARVRGGGLSAWAFMLLLYNYIRFGSITKTGYSNVAGVMVENAAQHCGAFCSRRARASSSTRRRSCLRSSGCRASGAASANDRAGHAGSPSCR